MCDSAKVKHLQWTSYVLVIEEFIFFLFVFWKYEPIVNDLLLVDQ